MKKASDFPPSPLPSEIKERRLALGLTQEEAGAIVYVTYRGWQQWELGERDMPRAIWEFFLLRTARRKPRQAHWRSR